MSSFVKTREIKQRVYINLLQTTEGIKCDMCKDLLKERRDPMGNFKTNINDSFPLVFSLDFFKLNSLVEVF